MPNSKETSVTSKTVIKEETPMPSMQKKVELLEEKEIPTKRKLEPKVTHVKAEEKSVALKKVFCSDILEMFYVNFFLIYPF